MAHGGAQIVMICRNPGKAEAIRAEILSQHNVRIDVVHADFGILDNIRDAADRLLKDYPRIDVLINSVGLHMTTRTVAQEGFETVFCSIISLRFC